MLSSTLPPDVIAAGKQLRAITSCMLLGLHVTDGKAEKESSSSKKPGREENLSITEDNNSNE